MIVNTDIDTLEIGEEKTFKTGLTIKRTMEDEFMITIDGNESKIYDEEFKMMANAMGYITREKNDVDSW